jgi:hypothetical protein
MIKSTIIMKSLLLRKGDGNYNLFAGQLQNLRYPPPEAHNSDPDGMDIPAFAHTGAHGENESGIPGVGHVYPGDWKIGMHGEKIYADESGGEHMHGIDGIIRAVGDSLLEHGIKVPAKDVIQKAIDMHNQDHKEDNHLPNVDSVAWRKMHLAPLQEQDHRVRSNYTQDGNLITTYTNSHGDKHRFGTYLESYAVPFNNQLGEVMAQLGHPNPQKHSWVKKPYVKPHRLHLVPDGEGGMQFGAQAVDSGKMQDGRIHGNQAAKWGGRMPDNRAFQNISSWGVAHHYPNVYYIPQSDAAPNARRQIRQKTVDSFLHHMAQASGIDRDAAMSNLIVDSAGARKHLANIPGEINGKPLKALLQTREGQIEAANYLSQFPAFQAVYGENRRPTFDADGNIKQGGSTVGRMNHLYGQRYGDSAEEGKGLDHFMSHSDRIGVEHQLNGKIGHHNRAKDAWSNVVLAASQGINHTEDDLSPEDLQAANIRLYDTPETRAAAPNVKMMLDHLFHTHSIAGGHERKEVPSQEELQQLQPIVDNIIQGGTHEDRGQLGVPEHIRYSDMSSSMTPVGASMQPEESTLKPRAGNEKGISGAPVPVSGGAPPAATSGAPPPPPPPPPPPVQDAGFYPQQMTRERGQRITQPQSLNLTPQQMQRLQFASAPRSQVADVMRQSGLSERNITPERMQQFQQNVGDPYQRFITQYAKSSDNPSAAKDRLIKAVEILQIEDARRDDEIIKHLPSNNLSVDSITDILYLAKMLDITSMDVSTILNTKGDWERISKTYGYSDKVVKVVKVSFGGV